MTKTIDFIFDFGSPNAYLAHFVLKDIAARRGAAINRIPCLLGGIFKATGNQAPMIAFANIKGKREYEALEMTRFIARHKLDRFRLNPHFPVNTLTIMRGLVAAEMDDVGEPYVKTVLAAMWERGLKMDDPAVIKVALDEAGLPGERLLARAGADDVKAKLAANTQAAVERGAFGIPTFFVGEEMFFGKERLGQVEDLLS
ncbi:MAG: 2-hydroxychromene-2-carboxylate isomerase [Hyphomonadaceae bacterium]|nr:2-hydroxychromene-2-carboxylate isomerase [Hyphomonadaceae bacterium]